MFVLLTTFPNKPRDCKKFILGLIKSNMAACVQRLQYVKSYYMREWVMKQEEEKILLIKADIANKAKIEWYFAKNHPYDIPEMLWLKPEDVNEAYLKWIHKNA